MKSDHLTIGIFSVEGVLILSGDIPLLTHSNYFTLNVFLFSYQSFKELPKLLDRSQRDGAPLPSTVRTNMQSVDKEKEGQRQGTGNLEVQKSLPQRLVFREANFIV